MVKTSHFELFNFVFELVWGTVKINLPKYIGKYQSKWFWCTHSALNVDQIVIPRDSITPGIPLGR